jgi:hypothetical protein
MGLVLEPDAALASGQNEQVRPSGLGSVLRKLRFGRGE